MACCLCSRDLNQDEVILRNNGSCSSVCMHQVIFCKTSSDPLALIWDSVSATPRPNFTSICVKLIKLKVFCVELMLAVGTVLN